MKLTKIVILAVTIFALFNTGCSPDQESPLQSANEITSVNSASASISDLYKAIEDGKNQGEADDLFHPGYVHNPIVGCDTLETPLVVAYGPTNITVGTVYITQTSSTLYFIVKPFAGLKVDRLALHEADGINNIPTDKIGTPDIKKFTRSEMFQVPATKAQIGVPMTEINQCQAYSLFVEIVTMSSTSTSNGWHSWAWGHDMGVGFGMELCVPACGNILSI
ncbi:MAG: hypothetical protein H6581_24460 [Bacteroidia bacterium]|nr:hypothetical protein [Bacteroidia bacterium]